MVETHRDVSAGRATWLVARREILVRVASKSFLISTAIMLALLVAGSLLFTLLDDGEGRSKVGMTADLAQYENALVTTARSADIEVDVQVLPDDTLGRSLLKDETIDTLVSTRDGRLHVTVRSDLSESMEQSLNSVAYRVALDRQIEQLGGNPQVVDEALQQTGAVDVEKLNPPKEYDNENLALGVIAGIVIYMALLFTGQMVAQGVVEEKSSRVVEVLLATIPPVQLLLGKVIGIGVVGLIQVAVVGIGGAVAALATGALTLSVSAASSTVVWLIAWFVLGYVFYALAFAAAGALVSRQEDIGGVVSPMMTLLIFGYVIGVSVLPSDPGSKVAEVMSLIPFFAPTLMPIRLAIGDVPVWQTVLSVGLVVLCIPLLTWVSARIYRLAIVRTGSRVKLREVL
jgi:ABC-2 type transport system permease protein